MHLARYQNLAPHNIRYDKRLKTYVATNTFKPVVSSPTASQYFAQLRSIADEVLAPSETWMGWIPPFEVVPLVPSARGGDTALRDGSDTQVAAYARELSIVQSGPSYVAVANASRPRI